MKSTILPTICLLTIGAGIAAAQAPQDPLPQAEHQWLQQFVGKWSTNMQAMMGPDQEPMKCEGAMDSRSLGGYWVMNEMKSAMLGEPITGIQTIGYDAKKKKYVGTWVDSMTSHLWNYEGEVDKSGKKLTLEADGPNFYGGGETTKFRDAYEFVSKDKIVAVSSMLGEDGKWIEFATGEFTRKE